jgi:hypothetical protein
MIVLLITNRYNYERESLLEELHTKTMISLLTPYFQVMMLKVSEKNKTIEKFPLKKEMV